MKKLGKTTGFTLVECVIAVAVVSLCLVPMVGLLPVGLASAKTASTQTAAMHLATAIAADIRTASATNSHRFAIDLNSAVEQVFYFDESGTLLSASDGESRYKAQITIVSVSPTMSMGRIVVTWPPLAGGNNILGSVDAVVPVPKT